METHLADWLKGTPDGLQAEATLRKCVHCGFCTATCPTYQLLGDELDGPRGRIYLMKQVVEGKPAGRATMVHLDRCLTCRNCESTCPSGVDYGHLVDIGRKLVERQVSRPLSERLLRWALREGLTRRWLFDPAMRIGRTVRPLLPAVLRSKVPRAQPAGRWPTRTHARKVVLLRGCVQPAMMPNIDAATARVLDAIGVQGVFVDGAGCCGAIRHHLNDHEGAFTEIRRNIDAWWPLLEHADPAQRIEAILVNASGCSAMMKEYGQLLRADPRYAEKAAVLSARVVDLSEWLPERVGDLVPLVKRRPQREVAFHPPCTLQHGQKITGTVERLLVALGATLKPFAESHLCCGSAGTYSVLQPEYAMRLRDRKIENLMAGAPQAILSANIGCVSHLQSGTETPVRHWIEWVDEAIA